MKSFVSSWLIFLKAVKLPIPLRFGSARALPLQQKPQLNRLVEAPWTPSRMILVLSARDIVVPAEVTDALEMALAACPWA